MRGYTITQRNVASGTAVVTLIELTNASTKVLLVTRAWVEQRSTVTSTQQDVQLVRKSGAGTNVTAPTVEQDSIGDAAIGATVRGMCTTEGTISATPYSDAFNLINGWIWTPTPQEYIEIAPSGIFGMRYATAPASHTYSAGLHVLELG